MIDACRDLIGSRGREVKEREEKEKIMSE